MHISRIRSNFRETPLTQACTLLRHIDFQAGLEADKILSTRNGLPAEPECLPYRASNGEVLCMLSRPEARLPRKLAVDWQAGLAPRDGAPRAWSKDEPALKAIYQSLLDTYLEPKDCQCELQPYTYHHPRFGKSSVIGGQDALELQLVRPDGKILNTADIPDELWKNILDVEQ